MFCMGCGTELPDDANFCLKCGRPQRGGAVPQSTGPLRLETCEIKYRSLNVPIMFGSPTMEWWGSSIGPSGQYDAGQSASFSGVLSGEGEEWGCLLFDGAGDYAARHAERAAWHERRAKLSKQPRGRLDE